MTALWDCANWGSDYFWKPASMAKLASLGLVAERDSAYFGKPRKAYAVTDAGRAALNPPPISTSIKA